MDINVRKNKRLVDSAYKRHAKHQENREKRIRLHLLENNVDETQNLNIDACSSDNNKSIENTDSSSAQSVELGSANELLDHLISPDDQPEELEPERYNSDSDDLNYYDDLPPLDESNSESESAVQDNFFDILPTPTNLSNNAKTEKLKEKLRDWAVTSGATLRCITSNLKLLGEFFPGLPKNAKTLLNTPRKHNIVKFPSGEFCYLGIEAQLRIFFTVNEIDLNNVDEIGLKFNMDGLPLFKSTKSQFWPILCMLKGFNTDPFVVAIYSGNSKPPVKDYLKDLTEELSVLMSTGIKITDEKYVKIAIDCFVCDMPARSFVKCIVQYNAYHGCEKCTVRGKFFGRVVFLKLNAPLREDIHFKKSIYKKHIKEKSPLCDLKFGMVSKFPFDYMHLVCLGVMRRMLFLWRDGAKYKRALFTYETKKRCSDLLINLQKFWPTDFNRKPRGLDDLERWKASELRSFLLYSGPVILKKILSNNVYQHFLLLSVSMFILTNNDLAKSHATFCKKLLQEFVNTSVSIYGKEFVVHNVHALIHLSDDAKIFGALDNFSSFPFENHLYTLKKLLRNSCFPLTQILNRLAERSSITYKEKVPFLRPIAKSKLAEKSYGVEGQHFATVYVNGQRISSEDRDRALLLNNGSVIIVRRLIVSECNNELFVVGSKVKSTNNFFSSPKESSDLCIYKINSLDHNNLHLAKVYRWCSVKLKGALLPYYEKFIFIPLHKRTYALVQYTKTNQYQLILSRWLVLDDNDPTAYVCNFPKKKVTEAEYQNAIQNDEDLPGKTKAYKAVLAYTTSSYQKGSRKLDKLLAGSDTTSTESDNASGGNTSSIGGNLHSPANLSLGLNSTEEEMRALKLEILLLKDTQDEKFKTLLKAILRLESKIDSNKALMTTIMSTRVENYSASPASSNRNNFSLPIRDLIEILNFDKDLDTNLSKTSKLVTYLAMKSSHGADIDAATRIVMSTLISNDLAGKLNLRGAPKVAITSFAKIWEVIELAVSEHEVAKATKNYPKLVKVAAGKWLRGYVDRDGGRTKRALLAAEGKTKKSKPSYEDSEEDSDQSDPLETSVIESTPAPSDPLAVDKDN